MCPQYSMFNLRSGFCCVFGCLRVCLYVCMSFAIAWMHMCVFACVCVCVVCMFCVVLRYGEVSCDVLCFDANCCGVVNACKLNLVHACMYGGWSTGVCTYVCNICMNACMHACVSVWFTLFDLMRCDLVWCGAMRCGVVFVI